MGQVYQRRRIGIILAVICSVLGVAASASAECAWVLWSKSGYTMHFRGSPPIVRSGDDWKVEEAYDTRQRCMVVLERITQPYKDKVRSDGPGDTVEIRGIVGEYLAMQRRAKADDWLERSEAVMLKCLPDTVDPRGPKGTK